MLSQQVENLSYRVSDLFCHVVAAEGRAKEHGPPAVAVTTLPNPVRL